MLRVGVSLKSRRVRAAAAADKAFRGVRHEKERDGPDEEKKEKERKKEREGSVCSNARLVFFLLLR